MSYSIDEVWADAGSIAQCWEGLDPRWREFFGIELAETASGIIVLIVARATAVATRSTVEPLSATRFALRGLGIGTGTMERLE